jgi:exopolyphosphatase/guanosine-5'-triphosphate,3'-diphosphate pyrophosphatase
LWEINKQDFSDFIRDIQEYSVDECVARFKMSYSEAETFQVSLLIYNLFFSLTNADRLLVPETNIRNGYLLSKGSAKSEELQKEFNSQIIASARNLLRKFHGDEKHAECVRMIATKIYDSLKEEIALDEHSRILLEVASILHDIGSFIRYDNHNLHSSYIIKNSEIFGLSRNENKIISEIAKYHKGSSVPQDDESFHLMSRIDRLTILKLTAILRIADAMDRGHIQKFSDFTIKLEQNAFIINTKKSKNTLLEKIALTEKAGMFESVFGYKVMLM